MREYHQGRKDEVNARQRERYARENQGKTDRRYNEKAPEVILRQVALENNLEDQAERYLRDLLLRAENATKEISSHGNLFLGEECQHGHGRLRSVHSTKPCYICKCIRDAIDRYGNRETYNILKRLKYHRLSQDKKEVIIRRAAEHNKSNPERRKEILAANLARHPERRRLSVKRQNEKESQQAAIKAWGTRHPHRRKMYTAKRRALRIRATPPWIGMYSSDIESIYEEADTQTQITGIKHEVDHIMPLNPRDTERGPMGLHVPWNLQVITREANREKSNQDPGPSDWVAQPYTGRAK
ncbi:hypothetical protein [Cyanobium sp. Copco_Reservoir_LC18]|uniref:hypothetical protein n=1 Tax=Cyanobium sp. Copco_Reservoir_LC18 TaxID=1328305 RepID=UPI001359A1BF|nr:hypothetical protein [Cyanobium sp. Copco_Reservoir_LC18]